MLDLLVLLDEIDELARYKEYMRDVIRDYKHGIHTMADGTKILLADMTDEHLRNAYYLFYSHRNDGIDRFKYIKAELAWRGYVFIPWPKIKK